jgi:hypothetical protein
MKIRFTWPRAIFAGILALGFAAWYVPQISAARYRDPIHDELERALGRKVKIGRVQFQLLPTPGFTVMDVVIDEDPAIGPEPCAYVKTLRARPKISALLGGPLELASVDLEDSQINLTRVEGSDTAVRWNFASLTRSKLPSSFPSVHLVEGRVNFKFGDTKSVFYLLNTDIDLWPPSKEGAPWDIRVHAEPARTDRPARGFGSFAARGQWHPANSSLTLDVKLEKSELSDIVTLFQGREADLHGHIQGQAHLAGPISRVGLVASVSLSDIHGWNTTPPGGGSWPLAVDGYIDVPGQTIAIRTTTTGKESPLDIRYRVTDYLARPKWGVTANFSQLPMAPVVGIARNLGVPIPPDMNYDGNAQGAVSFSMPEGEPHWEGNVRIAGSTLAVSGTPPLRIADADLRFESSTVTLTPAAVENDAHETALLSGRFEMSTGKLTAALDSDGMSIASLRRQISVAGVPLLSQATAGTWSGHLQYSNAPAAWSGEAHLKDAEIPFDAFSEPLHFVSADASLDGAGIVVKKFSLKAGVIEAQGDYRYEVGAERPHRFRAVLGRVSADALQKLLMPTLRRGNLLNYALNLGRVPEPDWMRAMHADGSVQIGLLDIVSAKVARLKMRVLWDGDQIRLTGVQGSANDGALSGSAIISLVERQPHYRLEGKLSGLPWRSGALDAEGAITTSGTGGELLSGLTAKGSFRARDVSLPPLDPCDLVEGMFDWSSAKLRLTQLTMTQGGNTYQGSAETQEDGQLAVKASDGAKQIQAALKM